MPYSRCMTEKTVAIAGAGPTGLMLAAELALAGVQPVLLERRATQDVTGSRAGGLHSRTLEILDQRGIAARFLSAGKTAQIVGFSGIQLDISDFPTRHPYVLALWQSHTERILAAWLAELGVSVRYGVEVTAFTQEETCVAVQLDNGQSLRAQYLIGCDGGRSFVRKAAGIDFPGSDPTTSNLIAEAELAVEPPQWGIRRDALGIHALSKMEDGKRVRILVTEPNPSATAEPTLRDLSNALIAVYGADYGVHSPSSLTRFTDAARQASAYRRGRILLAGDAAHIHPPDGGQGLQTGVQDAVNLGWKLAQVVHGISPATLLDSYHAERHPVGARVLRNAMASVVLRREDDRTKALRETVADLLAMPEARRRLAASLSGLDVQYDLGSGHPLLGRRMPDLDLVTAAGPLRLFTLLHQARPLLLNLGAAGRFDISPWSPRVQYVHASYHGAWELPALGAVAAPTAVLIRPDGYVAWVDHQPAALEAALTTWFGPPASQP